MDCPLTNPLICRICLTKEANLSLFDKDDKIQYHSKVMRCARVVIEADDGLPSRICTDCATELGAAYKFVVKCETADKLLRAFKTELLKGEIKAELPNNEIKTEAFNDFTNITLFDDLFEESSTTFNNQEVNHIRKNQQEFNKYSNFSDISNLSFNSSKDLDSNCKEIKRRRKTRCRKQTSLQCSVCGLLVKCASAMKLHLRTHTKEKPYSCDQCNQCYPNKDGLKRHIETKHSVNRQRKFICETCGSSFFTKNSIKIHMRRHTGEKPHSCRSCDASFAQRTSLIRHEKTHTGEKPHSCLICYKKFAQKSQVTKHMSVHSEEKSFSCHICSKAMKSRDSLMTHIRTLHTNDNTIICSYCGRTFNLRGNLSTHIRKMHSERSGQCTVCLKTCPDLAAHMIKHTGEKPFKCTVCDNAFASKQSLSIHNQYKHKNAEKYRCTIKDCAMSFPTWSMIEFHLLKHHTNHTPYICPHCSRGFYRSCDMSRHIKISHLDVITKKPKEEGD